MSSIININHNNHNQNATARKGSLMTMLTQSQKRKSTMKLFSILMVAILMFSPGGLLAGSLPSGYKVVKGKVTVTVDGKVMDVDQATQKAIVNWQKFGIDEGYTVNVNQINSAAAMLARVVGNDPSNILGNLNATGHFYLVNQNGVYFGPNSRVDVGAIIASTMDILDDDFMAGNLNFFGEAKGNVVNAGKINADAVALIGQNVQNTGTINASQVGLVAAQKAVTLSDFGGGSKLVVDFSDFNKAEDVAAPTTVVNEGTINAGDNGDVVLFAEAGEASNENGAIIANTAEISGAKVDLAKLGNVKANDLLIDPEGTLWIISGDYDVIVTSGPKTLGWVKGDQTIANVMNGIDASHITLSYDNIELSDDVTFETVKGLTLKTNDNNVNGIQVFGEFFGGGYKGYKSTESRIQKGIDYTPNHEFYAFDILVGYENGEFKYLGVDECNNLFETFGLFYNKELFRGTLDECLAYNPIFISTIGPRLGYPEIEDNFAEGVVIKPVTPLYFANGERIIIKNKKHTETMF